MTCGSLILFTDLIMMSMDLVLGSNSLPPGFRFHPTDEELCMFYLKRKVLGRPFHTQMISEVDVYRFAPWDLPSKSCLKTKDLNWYFFCPRLKKYANGGRTNRSTEHGYWKATGNDRTVQYNHRSVGKIKSLIFHMGKPPKGDRTDWVIHEYRLEDKVLADEGVQQDAFVLCKVYKKSGQGPKNGEHYGAPFVEEEWDSDVDVNVETDSMQVHLAEGCSAASNHSASVMTNAFHTQNVTAASSSYSVADNQNASVITNTLLTQGIAATSTRSAEHHLMIGVDVASVTVVPTSPAAVQLGATEARVLDPFEREDELGRLLSMFTEDEMLYMLNNDFCNGQVDTTETLLHLCADSDWKQFLADDGDGFLELNDLI